VRASSGASTAVRPIFGACDGPRTDPAGFDAILSISREKHLSQMSDTILDEYEEHAEEG
jgi:hypothetical protein